LSYAVVKECTSSAVGSTDDASVWDETQEGYGRLKGKAEDLLLQTLKYTWPTILKPYFHKAQWMTVGTEDDSTPTITPELDQPLLIMKDRLNFLTTALGYIECRRICRRTFREVQDLLWDEVLVKQDFTTLGALRFREDVRAFEAMAHVYVSASTNVILAKLIEGVELLSLPLKNESGPSLMEVANAFFGSVQESDQMMETLRFGHITKADARLVLKRRREATA